MAADADNIGSTIESPHAATQPSARPPRNQENADPAEATRQLLWEQLRTCYDPEIPINIVELGLIYECVVLPQSDGTFHADVKMTLTAPGCSLSGFICADVERKLAEVPGVSAVHVEIVFDPPWNPSMMSEAARLQLGMF
jgi:probable FeS assembly SUF system protein SufT